MASKNDFTKGSVGGSILRLALPMTLAQLINILYNVVDRIYIGRIPGTGRLALTGLGLCFPILMLVTAFSNLASSGGAPLSSIRRGRGDLDEAERIMGTSFFLLLVFGVLLTAVGLTFKKPILYLFGASSETFGYADSYLCIYLLGTVFVMIGLGMNSFISAQGFARTAMLSVALGAVVNIVLDPIFIYLLGMGVSGAALATVLAQGCSCVWVLRFLCSENAILRLRRAYVRPDWPLLRESCALGFSGFVMAFTNSLVQVVCNAALSVYGGDLYVGVMTVINSVREVAQMPVQGITNGCQPVLSYNYGAKAYDRVLKGIRFATLICVGYTTGAWVLIHFFGETFIRVFNSEPALVNAALPAQAAYFFGFFMMSFQFAGQSTFVALGRAKQAVFFSIFRKVIIVVPLTLLLPRLGLGVMGVFWAEPISNFIGGAACYLTMLSTVGRGLRKQVSALGRS